MKFVRRNSTTIVIFIILGLVAYASYQAGNYCRGPLCDSVHPSVRRETGFWEILSAISGPIAGIIALFTACYLGKKADIRQRLEWRQVRKSGRKKEIVTANLINNRMVDELMFIAKFFKGIIDDGSALTPQKFYYDSLDGLPAVPKRPMYENIGLHILELDTSSNKAIAVSEQSYREAVDDYKRVISVPFPTTTVEGEQDKFNIDRQEEILKAMRRIVNECVSYITFLSGDYEKHEYADYHAMAQVLEVEYYALNN